MSALHYFVRTIPDPDFRVSGAIIIIDLILMFGMTWVISRFREESKKIFKVAVVLLLIEQVTLYIWYILNPNVGATDGLPLYHCRIAMIALLVCVFFKQYNTKLCTYFTYLGCIGSIMALLVPDMDRYNFPHLTNFSFFVGHYALFFISMYLFLHTKVVLRYRDMAAITIVIHIIMEAVNLKVGSNYGFLRKPPSIIKINANPIECFVFFTIVLILGLILMRIINDKIIKTFRFKPIEADETEKYTRVK